MAATYRLNVGRRLVNVIVKRLVRAGRAGEHTYLLTVRGRKSGRSYSTPVTLVETPEARWLVAPYGEVGWVRNLRAAGEVTLSRAGSSKALRVIEEQPAEAAPVLQQYLSAVRVTRPFFDVRPDATLEEFTAEAPEHPVFRLLDG